MENSSKLRTLCILRVLEEYTDENHHLTTAEIVNILEEKYNLTTHRTTIPTDIS